VPELRTVPVKDTPLGLAVDPPAAAPLEDPDMPKSPLASSSPARPCPGSAHTGSCCAWTK
jgi:hypothetical protein